MVLYPKIKLKQGILKGDKRASSKGVRYYSFHGIPYAKPPLGKLRFKAPVPAQPWDGILDATRTSEGPACYQRHMVCFDEIVGSEDCLYLNVYTPEIRQVCGPYPVMVWIHGGAFVSGSGNSELCGSDFLLSQNVVLVTFNYRVGMLGFISFENERLKVPGNAGLKDQVMALRWVKDNIGHFRGNKRNVTLFGNGSGAACIHLHMLSPMSKGLFHKAILQSGCALNPWVNGVLGTGRIMTKLLGYKGEDEFLLLKLNETLVEDLYEAQEKATNANMVNLKWFCSPVVEKQKNTPAFLPKDPLSIIRSGEFMKVPIVIGYTSREGIYWDIFNRLTTGYAQVITDFATTIPNNIHANKGSLLSKTISERIENFYYGSRVQKTRMGRNPRVKLMDPLYQLITDTFFLRGIYGTIKNHCEIAPTQPIYFYRFSLESKLNLFKNMLPTAQQRKYPGAAHGDDMCYFFNTFITPKVNFDDEETNLFNRLVRLWTTFATTGEPPTALADTWIPTSKKRLEYLNIDKEWTSEFRPDLERMKFWDVIYQNDIRTRIL